VRGRGDGEEGEEDGVEKGEDRREGEREEIHLLHGIQVMSFS
tara:strand:+ start:725 stop:850 length:126 start_codon:yes stop_codon:yes gene_type:complete